MTASEGIIILFGIVLVIALFFQFKVAYKSLDVTEKVINSNDPNLNNYQIKDFANVLSLSSGKRMLKQWYNIRQTPGESLVPSSPSVDTGPIKIELIDEEKQTEQSRLPKLGIHVDEYF